MLVCTLLCPCRPRLSCRLRTYCIFPVSAPIFSRNRSPSLRIHSQREQLIYVVLCWLSREVSRPIFNPYLRRPLQEAMPAPTTNFRAGDRIRGAEWFHEIAGAIGTVLRADLVTGDDWAAQDLLVRFDRPVAIFEDAPPQRTFYHSAHNFEFVDEAVETMREMEANSDHDDGSSRLQSVSTQGSSAVDTEGVLADGARGMEVAPCQNKMLTVAALRAVIGHFEPDELAEAKLALERARMEREDFRQGYGPAFAAASPAEVCNLTWRRRADVLQEEACEYHEIVKNCALEAHGDRNPAATLQNIRALTEDFISSDDGEADD